MSKTVEEGLKTFVVKLGNVVEKVIDKVKNAQNKVSLNRGIKPVLSMESRLPVEKIKQLIYKTSDKIIKASLADLESMYCLEIGDLESAYSNDLLEQNAGFSLFLDIGPDTGQRISSRFQIVKAQPHRLPLAKSSFDFALARLATPSQKNLESTVYEIGRVMKEGSKGLVVDYHPYGLYAKKGSEMLRPSSTAIRGIEDYYILFKKAGLRIIDIREAWIDETVRSVFSEEEIHEYRELKGTPLVIFLFFYKPKGKSRSN